MAWGLRYPSPEAMMDILSELCVSNFEPHYRVLDMRCVPIAEQTLRVFQAFEALKRGSAFVLMASDDPQPMCDHMKSEIQDRCEVVLLDRQESAWKVLIKRIG